MVFNLQAEVLLSQWKGRSPRGQRPNRSQGSPAEPFSCTDITLLTVTRRDKSSPQCHIRMTGDWSRVRTWERARSQRLNPLHHMCFHKNMASSFQREVFSMSLLITHIQILLLRVKGWAWDRYLGLGFRLINNWETEYHNLLSKIRWLLIRHGLFPCHCSHGYLLKLKPRKPSN